MSMIRFHPPFGCIAVFFGDAKPHPIDAVMLYLLATREGLDRCMLAMECHRKATDEEWAEWVAFLASDTANQIRWWDWTKELREGRAAEAIGRMVKTSAEQLAALGVRS